MIYSYQIHYENFISGRIDKTLIPIYLILAGSGTGKSRIATELLQLAKDCAVNHSELQERLKSALVFNISFENGTALDINDEKDPDIGIGTRMLFQLLPNWHGNWNVFKKSYKIGSVKILEDLAIFITVDGMQVAKTRDATTHHPIEQYLASSTQKQGFLPTVSLSPPTYLINKIPQTNQPFIEIENEELKNLLWLLQPGVPLPSADTIKNEIIKSFDKERSNLKELLQNIPGHISFTLDCWTSANTIPFLGITSHWINIDWQLQETLIDFVKLSGPHSGDNLREAFVASCRDLGIFAKLLAVTTDNAMNNNTFVSSLADICYNEGINFDIDNNHVRCLAHVMNIAVQHALKSLKATAANNKDEVLNIDDNDVNGFHTIMKLRKLIVKIKSSPQQQERFSKACKLANLKYKELILDIVTCWNSTYEMIMCAIEYKEITVESVGRADRYMIKWVLNEEEWSKLVEISQLLHLFSRATKHISTNHYPTLTSTVLIFNWLIDNLEDYEHNLNGTSDIKGKVKEVIEKLKFYYIRTDASVYTIATNYYRDNNWEANFINNAHQVIKDIYQSGYAPNLTVFSNPENNDIEEEEDLTAHIYKHQQIVRDDDELDAYLKSPNAPPKTDVLTWWKIIKFTCFVICYSPES
ncbi:14787_t:CDS:10 [Entrophospora sp. SA101]|nr:14787_t:CDS:10 [Entrophospora sp. SA101]